MRTFKTIAATAVVALAASAVAFGGVYFGSPQAGSATALASPQATKAQAAYVKLTAKDLVKLAMMMNGQHKVRYQQRATHRQAGAQRTYSTYRSGASHSTGYRGTTYRNTAQRGTYRSGYHCSWYGSHSGSSSRGGCGCW